ncbi:hypothetical protein [Paracidovorax konjaci]|uniref:Uncharacterized protein n=1 Tax=Paracidovorax konjaci TaxID=32040 RepID=A0A1I1VHV1_9BURK|nr:hypothetical protein [Paracidovorax konjaci]SFD82484.1 hypothetical protein SAMN04489710_106331 [Paracidovorax konjaci]
MTSVSRISTLARILGAPTADSLSGGVARVAPVKPRHSASTQPTLPGTERRTSNAASMAPRADFGLLAGVPLRKPREATPASALTPPGTFAQRPTMSHPSRAPGSLLAPHAYIQPLRTARASAEALLAARSGTLLRHPEARRAAA